MDASQQNYLVLAVLLIAAAGGALLVGAMSSQSLREEGLRGVLKRWFRR
jgi:Mn2+/Fe2+ NRAMP family transporter